ncbi:MAG TPA: ribonuclease Z [Candidatus Coprenecus stercoravium]|uniref:Ribonuclease Z n=1 Tax=Candidatus Coprenecus stercoravium TaxID=2840735 RepID=A0A9D2GPP6_9BACT|nr:ribonuclease Z [Candidatus Coprenecus stercoravium]
MNFSLTTLGVSSASPTTDRYPSAHILNICGRLFLIDCGEGAQMLMKRHGISLMKLERIFLSHLHGDHVFGIFGLLSTLSMSGRTEPLHIYAPEGFDGILDFFRGRFLERDSYLVEYHPLTSGGPDVVFEDDALTVTALPLRHRVPTYGFLFREKEPGLNIRKSALSGHSLSVDEILALKSGRDVERPDGTLLRASDMTYVPYAPRSFAYISDTAVFDTLPDMVRGVDLLYHEATFGDDCAEKAEEMFHSTARQAAMTALSAGACRLVIGHFSSRYKDPSVLLQQARDAFPDTDLAWEGLEFEVPVKKISL